LLIWWRTFWLHKGRENSTLSERMELSKGLWSMKLV